MIPACQQRRRLPGWLRAMALLWAVGVLLVWPERLPAAPLAPDPQLKLIGTLYEAGEDFRTETEVLRFLHFFPSHPQRPAVELTRAKLYFRSGRFQESSLMLYSLLDRHPRGLASADARRLLGHSLVQQGRIDEALALRLPEVAAESQPALQDGGLVAEPLERLRQAPADVVTPESARSWSTWLPGTGFFLLGQPGKAWAAMGLNLVLTGLAVAAWNDQMPGVALALALAEISLYRGGRNAVYEEAHAQLKQRQMERRAHWSHRNGEKPLLGVAFRMSFGGG